MFEINKTYNMDCIEFFPSIPDKSINFIFCDLPYGVTQNKWDSVIPLDQLWEQYKRIIKDNGIIALTATQPFSSALISSNYQMFKYEWIWKKNKSTGHLNAKKMPLKQHESILIFYKKPGTYNPQKTTGHKPVNSYKRKTTSNGSNYGETKSGLTGGGQTDRYPTTILEFPVVNNDSKIRIHPSQKPLEMIEYMLKTYTNEQDLVLDNCMGSGSTIVGCIRNNRNYIGVERELNYFQKANEWIKDELQKRN